MFIDVSIQTVVTLLFSYYIYIQNENTSEIDVVHIILYYITMDSIYSSCFFIKNFLIGHKEQARTKQNKDYEKTILDNLNKLYKLDLLERYIYYILLSGSVRLLKQMIWKSNIYIDLALTCSSLFFTAPYIMNICYQNLYLFRYIEEEKKKFAITVTCKQLSNIINFLSESYLKYNPDIKFHELVPLFENYSKNMSNVTSFFKQFLIISLVTYFRKNTGKLYKKVITIIYNYHTGDLLHSIDIESARFKFKQIVTYRRWKKLLDTDILQSIIYLYTFQEDNNLDVIWDSISLFNYTTVKMFTIWTISSVVDQLVLVPILSLFFLFYERFHHIGNIDKRQYIIRLVSGMVYFTPNKYVLSAIICEYGYFLLFNRVMYSVYQYIYHKLKEVKDSLIHFKSGSNIFLISYIGYLLVTRHSELFSVYINGVLFSGYVILNANKRTDQISAIIISLFGYVNDFDIYHSLFLYGVCFISNNLYYTLYNKTKSTNINNILDIIQSYYGSTDVPSYIPVKQKQHLIFDEKL